jgi:hypothetical protein
MSDLDRLREIYVADVDDETREDNLKMIAEWESTLREGRDFLKWQGIPTTQSILSKAKEAYIECSLILAKSRELTEAQCYSLQAKQDAALWIVSIMGIDVKPEIDGINAQIRTALTRDVT